MPIKNRSKSSNPKATSAPRKAGEQQDQEDQNQEADNYRRASYLAPMQSGHLLAFGFDCLPKLHNAVLALMGGELTRPRTGF